MVLKVFLSNKINEITFYIFSKNLNTKYSLNKLLNNLNGLISSQFCLFCAYHSMEHKSYKVCSKLSCSHINFFQGLYNLVWSSYIRIYPHNNNVCIHSTEINFKPVFARLIDSLGKMFSMFMIICKPVNHVIKSIDRRCCQDSGLSHTTT